MEEVGDEPLLAGEVGGDLLEGATESLRGGEVPSVRVWEERRGRRRTSLAVNFPSFWFFELPSRSGLLPAIVPTLLIDCCRIVGDSLAVKAGRAHQLDQLCPPEGRDEERRKRTLDVLASSSSSDAFLT